MARAYYNEINPDAVAILRQLIADGVIADGDVDDRSIKDVQPKDLKGYVQHHFFAGGGLWSVAARLAGWPDDRPLWTASCPCQGESVAGKRLGADDPRHLWPDLYRLLRTYRPAVVMGEQVAAAAGTHWLDRVCSDLEDEGYASRAVDIPACAVDAPHQRQRLWWVAVEHATSERRGEGRAEHELRSGRDASADADGELSDLLDEWLIRDRHEPFSDFVASRDRLQPDADCRRRDGRPEASERCSPGRTVAERAPGRILADADLALVQGQPPARQQPVAQSHARPLRNGSWWADAEWVVSPLDGKARRTKPGLPFLVDGLPGRVGLWSVVGNAVSPILAAEVIAAFLDTEMTPALSATGGRDA